MTDFFSEGLSALASGSTRERQAVDRPLPAPDRPGRRGELAVTSRASSNRGNAYPNELDLGPIWQKNEIQPSFDCRNAGGAHKASVDQPPCYVQSERTLDGKKQGQSRTWSPTTTSAVVLGADPVVELLPALVQPGDPLFLVAGISPLAKRQRRT